MNLLRGTSPTNQERLNKCLFRFEKHFVDTLESLALKGKVFADTLENLPLRDVAFADIA